MLAVQWIVGVYRWLIDRGSAASVDSCECVIFTVRGVGFPTPQERDFDSVLWYNDQLNNMLSCRSPMPLLG